MKILFRSLLNFFILLFHFNNTIAQNCAGMNIQVQADIPSVCSALTMTMIHDNLGRPFLYVANKEAGLKIYDISNLTSPLLVTSIPTSSFDSLEVMNVSQQGDYLFLAIGNYFSPQNSGMAIVNVANPAVAFVTDYYEFSGTGGSGIVKAEGNYAYLGAMNNGLIILDILDKANIAFVSQYLPDINFPDLNPDPAKYNARGMEVKNDIVYLCFDAGGLRIINTINKNTPIETGRFSNPVLNGLPRAYNNIVIDDTLAFIAVDYCGMEVLNISDTANIILTGWWNPYNCPGNNWFTSPVHANEIQFNKACNEIFLSTGKSDLHVIDVTNPSLPDSCNFYGGVGNNTGTWGVGLYGNEIYLSYICNPLPFPFPSSITGVKILTYSLCSTDIHSIQENSILLFQNPVYDFIDISLSQEIISEKYRLLILDLSGKKVMQTDFINPNEKLILDVSKLSKGIYFLKLFNEKKNRVAKFVKLN